MLTREQIYMIDESKKLVKNIDPIEYDWLCDFETKFNGILTPCQTSIRCLEMIYGKATDPNWKPPWIKC